MKTTPVSILLALTASFALAQDKPAEGEGEKKPEAGAEADAPDKKKLLEPAKLTETAPATYKVKFATTKGDFVIEVTREWSPNGADRFYNLVKNGFYDDTAFFRCIKGFMVQFGINGDPEVNRAWQTATIKDDPVKGTNTKGMITFAKTGAPDSRTSQVFINFENNARLDKMGFSPFGKIVEGMEVVESLNGEYGEGAPQGRGPEQGRCQGEGNAYLKKEFPNLDWVKTARIMK